MNRNAAKTFLITGGSGLVGERLSSQLLQRGNTVKHLSRTPRTRDDGVQVFKWDIPDGFVDPAALENVDVVVHLAGAEIMDERWTPARKKVLVDSRVDSLRLLRSAATEVGAEIETLISSSAQGYYEPNQGRALHEEDPAGVGYMGQLCVAWESEALKWEQIGTRIVINRIGLVLAPDGGALELIADPIKKRIGSYFGKGNQTYPWIHIDDLCGIIHHETANESVRGAFNAAAPDAVTQREMVKSIATHLGKSVVSFPIPKSALKLAMGERFSVLVDSFHLSPHKIQQSGYTFAYSEIDDALDQLLKN